MSSQLTAPTISEGSRSSAPRDARRATGVRTPRRHLGQRPLIAFLALAAFATATLPPILGGAPAEAHDYLASSSPAKDENYSGPLDAVSLTFNETPLAGLEDASQMQVSAPDGTVVSSGSVAVAEATLSIPVAFATPGLYTVLWQSVSSDGHPISGTYTFTWQSGGADAESPTPLAPAEAVAPTRTPAATSTPTQEPTPAASSAASSDRSNEAPNALLIVATIGGILLLAAAIGAVLMARGRHRNRAGTGNAHE